MPREVTVGSQVGRYALVEELGRGGMAVVYRAKDLTLGRDVAVKVMHAHLWADAEAAARFEREARAAAALRHPNIISVYDYGTIGEEGETPIGYIVVEFLQGLSLREFLRARGRLLPDVAAIVISKIAEALEVAHKAGIIHRDIKPDNVMIAEGGRLVLTDFGLARATEGETLTQTGALLGSPAYMAPEQARGDKVDARTDLFALGTVLYELCTGRVPFSAKEPLATVLRIVEGTYAPPTQINPQVGRDLERVIKRLLAPRPEDRYEDAGALRADLGEILGPLNLGTVDEALTAYFDDPGPFNKEVVEKVIESSLRRAEGAAETRDFPRALAACDRVLAFEGAHVGALEIMERLSVQGRGRRYLWAALGACVVIGGGVALGVPHWTRDSGDLATGRQDGGAVASRGVLSLRDGAGTGVARGSGVVVGDATFRGGDASPRVRVDVLDASGAATDASMMARHADARRRHRRSPRWRGRSPSRLRGRDAGPALADARRSRAARDLLAPPPPRLAELRIEIGPWCDAFVDGKPVGKSPLRKALHVAPGRHTVRCENGPRGAKVSRQVTLLPGERRRLAGLVTSPVRVVLRLSRGDAVKIDGRIHRGPFSISAEPHRVDVLRGAKVVAGTWVRFPPVSRCVLEDNPKIRCRDLAVRHP